MNISIKLWSGFGAMVLLTVIVGVMGYHGISGSVNTMGALIEQDIPLFETALAIKVEMLQHRRYEKDFFLNTGNPKKQDEYLEHLKDKSASIKAAMERLEEIAQADPHLAAEVKAKVTGILSNYDKYYQGLFDVLKQLQADPGIDAVKANNLMTPYKQFIHDLESDLDLVADKGGKILGHTTEEAMTDGSNTKLIVMGLIIACFILAAIISILIPMSIKRAIVGVTEDMSESAEQIAAASGQFSSASQSLAEGMSEQAASIEETSASMEEMSSMTRQNADNAGQANSLATETKAITASCANIMQEMAVAISMVNESSKETKKIVKTVDEIAFQTNLLALNAAVEAARAGEAGAGFAVVADEVRNLAMRASEAAGNTSEQIEDIGKKIDESMEMVFKTIDEFSKVDENTGKVNELVGEIAAATREQSQGIEQVNSAIAEMDKVVQRNAATAEESAGATEEMSSQAEQLRTLVNHLISLVGGGESNIRQAQFTAVRTKPATRRRAPIPKKTHARELRRVSPNQMIPMDDEDFNDY